MSINVTMIAPHIAGVVVNTLPQDLSQIEIDLALLPGVEVHATQGKEEGKMVITIEGETEFAIADTFAQLQKIQGILSVTMVYHGFDSDIPSASTNFSPISDMRTTDGKQGEVNET